MAIIRMDRMGNVCFLDDNENEIEDFYEIQDIKKYSNWKEIVYKQSINLINQVNQNIENGRNIYTKTEKLITQDEIKQKISQIKLEEYIIPDFVSLSEDKIRSLAYDKAETEAKSHISLFPPMTFKTRRKNYIENLIPQIEEEIKKQDKEKREKYYNEQNKVKREKDLFFQKEYQEKRAAFEKYITTDEDCIYKELIRLYGTNEEREEKEATYIYMGDYFIANFWVVKYEHGMIKACIILPIPSDIEDRKANMLASNKISVKIRSEDDIIEDWHLCCCGCILNAFSKLFNVNTNINSIEIESIYFLNDEAIGDDKQYNYDNTFFTREDFSKLNISAINPIKTIERFHKDVNISEKESYYNNESDYIQSMEKNAGNVKYSESYSSPNYFDETSINIICSCLSEIISQFGTDYLYKENSRIFHNICNDLYPNNKEEIDFLIDLSEEGILEELLLNKFKENFTTRILTIGSNYANNEILALFLERLSQIFS